MPKKSSAKRPTKRVAPAAKQPRRLALPKRIWYNPLTWRHRPPVPTYKPLPKARVLFGRAIKLMWRNWRVFGGITLIYALLSLVLVRGFSGGSDLADVKSTLDSLLSGTGGKILGSVITFATLLGGGSNAEATATSGVYQSLLLILCSLAFIWTMRQAIANHTVRIRDSFYQGMYPLVPFALVFMLLSIQLLPLVIGTSLYSLIVNYGILVHPAEKITCVAVLVLLALWALRMVTATIFALYIATLPNMTPLRAYRSAKQMVYGRRLLIWRKLIFLPVVLLLIAAAVLIPLISLYPPAAVWLFFVCTMMALPVVHGYLYGLYREMI